VACVQYNVRQEKGIHTYTIRTQFALYT